MSTHVFANFQRASLMESCWLQPDSSASVMNNESRRFSMTTSWSLPLDKVRSALYAGPTMMQRDVYSQFWIISRHVWPSLQSADFFERLAGAVRFLSQERPES